MILYYAIISYCLIGTCSNATDLERYIYENPLPLKECLLTLDKMVVSAREYVPEIRHRSISTLCVRITITKDIEKYKVWVPGKVI